MIEIIIHLAILIILPPLLSGIINKTKAICAGRTGAPLLQPYYDLARLIRKGIVLSVTTTWVFRAGPIVTLASVFLAGLLLPIGPFDAPVSFAGDFILFAYLFGLARFFATAAALDTGSAFEGMGSSREVTLACLSEPALFFAFIVLAKKTGSFSLNSMLHGNIAVFQTAYAAPLVFIALGLFVVLLAETCRIPVDDPETHLELTMIHEVMALDHSGPLFGMILYSSYLKLFILGSMLLHLIAPFNAGRTLFDWPYFIFKILALAAVIGLVESFMARLRMRRVPFLLTGALLLCAFGFILLIR